MCKQHYVAAQSPAGEMTFCHGQEHKRQDSSKEGLQAMLREAQVQFFPLRHETVCRFGHSLATAV